VSENGVEGIAETKESLRNEGSLKNKEKLEDM